MTNVIVFFLEHAGELRINILRRKKGIAPSHQYKMAFFVV